MRLAAGRDCARPAGARGGAAARPPASPVHLFASFARPRHGRRGSARGPDPRARPRDVLKIGQSVFSGGNPTAVVLKIGQSVFPGSGPQAPGARARPAAPLLAFRETAVRTGGVSFFRRAKPRGAGPGGAAAAPKSGRPTIHFGRFSAHRPPSGCRKTHCGQFSAHPAGGEGLEGRIAPGLGVVSAAGASIRAAPVVKTRVHCRVESRKVRLRGQNRPSLEANAADRPRIPAREPPAPATATAKPQFRKPRQEAWSKPAFSVPTAKAGFDHGAPGRGRRLADRDLATAPLRALAGRPRARPAASRTKPAPIAAGRSTGATPQNPAAAAGPSPYAPAICGGFVRRIRRWANHEQQGR